MELPVRDEPPIPDDPVLWLLEEPNPPADDPLLWLLELPIEPELLDEMPGEELWLALLEEDDELEDALGELVVVCVGGAGVGAATGDRCAQSAGETNKRPASKL